MRVIRCARGRADRAATDRAAAQFPGAVLHVMHPVKSRRLIAEAYHDFGVRTFALDSDAELDKIEAATGHAKDLTLVVRVACPSTYSEISLEGKFGSPWNEAPGLPVILTGA